MPAADPAEPGNKIFPQNLTAQAAYDVLGNPPSTRPESGVANCFPGLEFDHRNLDGRFFPGLVVAFADRGVRIVEVDPGDGAVFTPPTGTSTADVTALRRGLATLSGRLGRAPQWFVSTIEQAGTRIELAADGETPMDGMTAWRLVRSLRPGPVSIDVTHRPPPATEGTDPPPTPEPADITPVTLAGWRREYTDPDTGVIHESYRPGELTQSLCSPWTHDFRDCSCTYWASNHPDIVFPATGEDERQPGGLPTDPEDRIRLNWLRDPDLAGVHGQALPSQGANRPYEASHFQINRVWQDLAIVLEGREIAEPYIPRSQQRDRAEPFASGEELMARVRELASLEHLVAVLYLYALFSVIQRDEASGPAAEDWPTLADDVTFTRSVVLEVAIGEMHHLRWANHMLWGIAGVLGLPYEPAVEPPASALPGPDGRPGNPVELGPLTLERLAVFTELERASTYIDGQYARVTATLRQTGWPAHLHQLASLITEEGEEHYLHFRDLQRLLTPYGDSSPAYLRDVAPGDPDTPAVAAVLDDYRRILDLLEIGYQLGDHQNQQSLGEARTLMFTLQEKAEQLARQGVGVPFLAPWQAPT